MSAIDLAKAFLGTATGPGGEYQARHILREMVAENENFRAMLTVAHDGVGEAIAGNARLCELLRRALVAIDNRADSACVKADIRSALDET